MPVALSCKARLAAPWRAYLAQRGRQLLHALALERYELGLSLVADAEMQALNRTYRRKDRPTDVLAFPLHDGTSAASLRRAPATAAARLLGDVVISIDTAAVQARALACPLAARLDALLIHGVLHLIGYDHERSAAEERRMSRRARALEAMLGRVRVPRPPSLRRRAPVRPGRRPSSLPPRRRRSRPVGRRRGAPRGRAQGRAPR